MTEQGETETQMDKQLWDEALRLIYWLRLWWLRPDRRSAGRGLTDSSLPIVRSGESRAASDHEPPDGNILETQKYIFLLIRNIYYIAKCFIFFISTFYVVTGDIYVPNSAVRDTNDIYSISQPAGHWDSLMKMFLSFLVLGGKYKINDPGPARTKLKFCPQLKRTNRNERWKETLETGNIWLLFLRFLPASRIWTRRRKE